MQTMKQNNSCSDFKLHVYRGYVQNNFLAEYEHGILLIDGASRPDLQGIKRFVEKEMGRKKEDVRLVAVTHCHPDHAGGAGLIRADFGVPVAAPHDIDAWYSGPGGVAQHISDTLQSNLMAKKLKVRPKLNHYQRKLRPDFRLYDRSSLPYFPDWRVIHAPGHTSHNIILYNKANSLLYLADTVINSNGKYLPPVPVLYPRAMKDTIGLIMDMKPQRLLLAHSNQGIMEYDEGIFRDVLARIEKGYSPYINFFYLVAKFTGEYRKQKKHYL